MAGLREIWSHSSWVVWIKCPSSQDLRSFLGTWTMRKESHLHSLSPPVTSFPSSFEGGSSAASHMSLVLEEWPVLGAWVSVSSLWGTLSWDLSVRPSSPYWHGTCWLSPPPPWVLVLFVPCSIPPILAFVPLFFSPTQNLHKELSLLEGQSQERLLACKKLLVML